MKKLLILFLLPFLVSAQTEKHALSKEPIVVGEARNTNGIVATMNKIVGNPDYYIMSFKNIKNTSNSDFITFGFYDFKNTYDNMFESVALIVKNDNRPQSISETKRNRARGRVFHFANGNLEVRIDIAPRNNVKISFFWVEENGLLSGSDYITPKQFCKLFAKPFLKKQWRNQNL
jgi:hypothetical protein